MKRISIILVTIFVGLSLSTQAQPEKKREQIKAYKIAFITEQLQLTPAEAEKFWPLYNEYEQKKEEYQDQMHGKYGPPHHAKKENLSDEELDDLMVERMNHEKQMVDLKIDYYQKFKKVLSIRKTYQLYEAEMDFRKKLLEQLGGPGQGPGRGMHRGM